MFTIALIGPDGAGKTTVGQRLEKMLPWPVKYLYLGINLETRKLVMPTTRLLLEIKRARGGRPDLSPPSHESQFGQIPKIGPRRALLELKSMLRVLALMAEEWFCQSVIWHYQRRGYIVLFDRHFFFDYYFHDIAPIGQHLAQPDKEDVRTERLLSSRFHGFTLARLYPRPDLVILLDAPAEVLFARKGEGTIELMERRRQEYLAMGERFENFAIVDATQSQQKVLQDVTALIQRFYSAEQTRRGGKLSMVP